MEQTDQTMSKPRHN